MRAGIFLAGVACQESLRPRVLQRRQFGAAHPQPGAARSKPRAAAAATLGTIPPPFVLEWLHDWNMHID